MSAPTIGYIAAQTARASRNSIIANGIVLAVVTAILWMAATYYYCFFFGPFPVSDAQLQAMSKSQGGLITYAVLPNRVLQPTGWNEVVMNDDKLHERSSYFLTPVGEQHLLILAKSPADGERLVGPVYPLGTLEADVVDKIETGRPDLAGKIMPIMLNHTAAFTVAGYLGLAILVPTLRQYGEPAEMAAQIDHEIEAGPIMRFGKCTLTSLWLVRPTAFGLTAVSLRDLVWIYHVQKTTESLAVLSLTNGKQMTIFLKAAEVEELIAEIQKRIPWILCGYSKARLTQWQKCRSAMIAEVNCQRERFA